MAFEALSRSKPKRRRNQKAAVHIYSVESRRNSDLVDVRIRLTKPLMDELGWTENEKINVLVGTEEHVGSILLQADRSGMFKLRRQSLSSFVLSSRAIPLPPGIKIRASFEAREGELLLWTSKPS